MSDTNNSPFTENEIDLRLFSEAVTAVQPDEILKSVPHSKLVVFKHGERWGVGSPENKYLSTDQVIPLVYFDAEQITVVQTVWSRESAFVGVRGDRWAVYCGGDEPVCDYAQYEEALDSARRWIAKLSRYNFEKIILVDEIGESLGVNLFIFRLGGQWGVGYRTCIVHWGRSTNADHHVLPVTGWFDSKDVECIWDIDDAENLWQYFLGETRDHWSLYDYKGTLLGAFPSREEAHEWAFPNQEPEPIGDIDHSSFDDDAGPPLELEEEWDEQKYVEPEPIGGSSGMDDWVREETNLTMTREVEMRSETGMDASAQSDEGNGRPDMVPEQLSDEQFLREIEELNDAGRFPLGTLHPGESPPEDAKRNGKDRTDWAKEGF